MNSTHSKEDILQFLRSVNVMSASVNGSVWPVSTLLLFAVDSDLTFYFATKDGTYKHIALQKDNKISFSIWVQSKFLVQSHGNAFVVTDPLEIEQALDKLVLSVASMKDFWPPILQIDRGDYVVYKIKPVWLRVQDLSHKNIHSTSQVFTEFTLN